MIGQWVRRVFAGGAASSNTKWHKVESMVDGEPVIKCGRRMPKKTRASIGNALVYIHEEFIIQQKCKRCS